MQKNFIEWNEFEEQLNITEEQKAMIQFESELIEATVQARKNKKLSQRDLSKKSGIAQPAIARIERCSNSPQVSTLLKLLYPLGYTLKIVPIDKKNKQ